MSLDSKPSRLKLSLPKKAISSRKSVELPHSGNLLKETFFLEPYIQERHRECFSKSPHFSISLKYNTRTVKNAEVVKPMSSLYRSARIE